MNAKQGTLALAGLLLALASGCPALAQVEGYEPGDKFEYPARTEDDKTQVLEHLRSIARELDDPANPYHGMYEDFDRWAFERILGRATSEYFIEVMPHMYSWYTARSLPEGWAGSICSMDQQGNLVPLWLGTLRDRGQLPRRLRDIPCQGGGIDISAPETQLPSEELLRVCAPFGEFPHTIAGEVTELLDIQEYPLVPDWLARNPPLAVLFVPNGDLLFYGEPGQLPTPPPLQSHQGFSLYSADGHFLRRCPELGENISLIDWQPLYWPRFRDFKAQAEMADLSLYDDDGYCILLRRGPGPGFRPEEVVGVWDYDGRPLDPDAAYPAERRHMGEWFVWAWRLSQIYAEQQHYKLLKAH